MGGCKTKWRDEYLDKLKIHLTDGSSFTSFGGVIGVNHSTLHKWTKQFPELKLLKEKHKKRKIKLYA